MYRRMLLLWMALIGNAVLSYGQNVLTVSSGSGHPGDTVTIGVALTNSAANVVALQAELPLGTALSYVEGSCTLTSRGASHSVTASVVNGALRIVSYSFSLTPYSGTGGDLVTFRLKLNSQPGTHTLALSSAVVSDATGQSLSCSTVAGSVTVLCPKLQINTSQVDYGHVPIRSTYWENISISNVGTEDLVVSALQFSAAEFAVPDFDTLTLAPDSTESIAVRYMPTAAGAVSERVNIVSNSIVQLGVSHAVTLAADPFAVNELHVCNTGGVCDSVVTVALTMNNMDAIAGLQCRFKMPAGLQYVSGSFALGSRSSDHVAFGSLQGDTLILLAYSPTNSGFAGTDDTLATFDVLLQANSGTYYLTPIAPVLSDVRGVNVLSASYRGYVQVSSPRINCSATLDMGVTPVTVAASQTLQVRNSGSAPLNITGVVFNQPGYRLLDSLPLTIANGRSHTLTVEYSGMEEGDFSAVMQLYSNDPTTGVKPVNIGGRRYEPNGMALSLPTGRSYLEDIPVAVELNNYTSLVAVQFDFHFPAEYTVQQTDFVASERCEEHELTVFALNDSVWRVLLFSMQNSAVDGHSGTLLTVNLHPQANTIAGSYGVSLSNAVLSDSQSNNKLTEALPTGMFITVLSYDTVTVTSSDETMGTVTGGGVIETGHIATLTATAQSCHRFVSWSDGNTENPRNLTVDGDTVLVALFEAIVYAGTSSPVACGSYSFNGKTYLATGNYQDTLTTATGCDSILTLNVTVHPTYRHNDIMAICDDMLPYSYGDSILTATGVHTIGFSSISGCDSVVTLALTVNETYDEVLYAGVPQGDDYTENGFNILNVQQDSTYTQTLLSRYGCDSIVTLHVTMYTYEETYIEASICAGDSYTENGFNLQNQQTSGIHTLNLQTVHGCDSTVRLNLTVHPNKATFLQAELCQGESYTEYGFALSDVQTSDTLEQHLTTAHGCDSVVTLALTVHETYQQSVAVSLCDDMLPYSYGDTTLATAGVHTIGFTSISGCDSVMTLTLTANPTYQHTDAVAVCDNLLPYSYGDSTLTASGVYTIGFSSVNGCDSVVTLALTTNPTTETVLYDAVCQGSDYANYGFSVTNVQESDTLVQSLSTWLGCDSTVTLCLAVMPVYNIVVEDTVARGESYTEHGFSLTDVQESGTYTQELTTRYGCDSVITLNLTVQAVGIEAVEKGEEIAVVLYPNPADKHVTLQVEALPSDAEVLLYDAQGRRVLSQTLKAGQEELTLNISHLAAGSYHVRIVANHQTVVRKLMVR